VLSDSDFMRSLQEFDKDNIPVCLVPETALVSTAVARTSLLRFTYSSTHRGKNVGSLVAHPCTRQDAVIKKLKKYIDDPSYNPETVAKQSRAAMSLCMWTRAMDVYHRVAKVGRS
jgi:hypothetical protein